jgi:hypothetical protein
MVGTEFAGYRLNAVISRTNMSVVYTAEHPRLGHAVALKVLAPDLASNDRFRERFVSESRMAAGIRKVRELLPEARAVVERAREAGSKANFILCCAPRELRTMREAFGELEGVSAVDGYAAPENVLFAANELRAGAVNNRKTPRLLYGTTVAFRGAGRDKDELGFSYNVSAGGIYVRTLAPPDDDETWLELRPPRTDRLVRLVAKVAWRRRFNYNENATVPPGFGAQIVDGARADLDAWTDGCATMATLLG